MTRLGAAEAYRVPGAGIEPASPDPKSGVLPLHHPYRRLRLRWARAGRPGGRGGSLRADRTLRVSLSLLSGRFARSASTRPIFTLCGAELARNMQDVNALGVVPSVHARALWRRSTKANPPRGGGAMPRISHFALDGHGGRDSRAAERRCDHDGSAPVSSARPSRQRAFSASHGSRSKTRLPMATGR